jgi:hypothetical protein
MDRWRSSAGTAHHWLALILLASTASCTALFGNGDTGAVLAHVRDQNDAPVAGAPVGISQVNGSGGTFTVSQQTKANGDTFLGGVQSGDRTVSVTLPAGYAAGSDPLSKPINVLRGQTIQVTFVLQRQASTGKR